MQDLVIVLVAVKHSAPKHPLMHQLIHQNFWLRGQSLLTSYVGDQGFGLQFCSKCGSTLVGIFNNTIHGVTLGCINGDPEIEIGKHIYVGSKAKWEKIPEGVLQFNEGAPKIT